MPDIVFIQWKDSTSWNDWQNLPLQNTKLIVINTVGYIIEEHKDRYVIANTISSANHANGMLAIPKGAVIKYKILKRDKND